MLERFRLLDRHYLSDIERLRAIEEGGTLFSVLSAGHCPLCGAAPDHHPPILGVMEILMPSLRLHVWRLPRSKFCARNL